LFKKQITNGSRNTFKRGISSKKGISVVSKPSFKGGKKLKMKCKHYLPNPPLPFDHNGADERYKNVMNK
jgi:hypothetical protein